MLGGSIQEPIAFRKEFIQPIFGGVYYMANTVLGGMCITVNDTAN